MWLPRQLADRMSTRQLVTIAKALNDCDSVWTPEEEDSLDNACKPFRRFIKKCKEKAAQEDSSETKKKTDAILSHQCLRGESHKCHGDTHSGC